MNSTLKALSAQIKQCDVILYVLDARCPNSCLNPSFEQFTARKPVLFVLNKADLAPSSSFKGISLVSTQTNSGKKVVSAIKKMLPNKPRVHAMVIGVPNCGKSTLINNLARAGKTKTADRPGVTRQPQWVAAAVTEIQLFLLDTPGILWPNLENPRVAKNLAYIGSIKDDVLDTVELARELLADLDRIKSSPSLEGVDARSADGVVLFQQFCKKRGFILKGGRVDELRGAKAVLTDFRAGKFGRFNLDGVE